MRRTFASAASSLALTAMGLVGRKRGYCSR
jgi:hypothetical protein